MTKNQRIRQLEDIVGLQFLTIQDLKEEVHDVTKAYVRVLHRLLDQEPSPARGADGRFVKNRPTSA